MRDDSTARAHLRRYPSRRTRTASQLRKRDIVHDGLAPMTIVDFEDAAPGCVRVVGVHPSGTLMRAMHPAGRELDVTRMIRFRPRRRRADRDPARRHLTLVTSETA